MREIQPADLPCWWIFHVAGQLWPINMRSLRSSWSRKEGKVTQGCFFLSCKLSPQAPRLRVEFGKPLGAHEIAQRTRRGLGLVDRWFWHRGDPQQGRTSLGGPGLCNSARRIRLVRICGESSRHLTRRRLHARTPAPESSGRIGAAAKERS